LRFVDAVEFGDAEALGRIADDRGVGRAGSATDPMATGCLHRRRKA
jgi:hypothetical protein